MGEVEIHEAQAAVAGQQHVLRLDVQMHEAAVMHHLHRAREIDEDPGDVAGEHRVAGGHQQLEVSALDVFQHQRQLVPELAVLDVADDELPVLARLQGFGARVEALPFGKGERRVVLH